MDLMHTAQLREHVIAELTSVGGRMKNADIIILCPFHPDSRPSLRVHIGHKTTPGTYHCFACKAKGGWNQLAAVLKLKTVQHLHTGTGSSKKQTTNDITDPFNILSKELLNTNILSKEKNFELQGFEDLPPGFKWRGFGRKFYQQFGGKFFWDSKKDLDYLYFPLTMNQNYVGYTICCLKAGIEPKYEIFAHAINTFFLFDYVPESSPIILVEGHFDALRMHAEGLPAIALFGVSNWGPQKKALLLSKLPSKVLICFDGDKAGYDASAKIFTDLRSGVDVDILYPPPGMDPGNMADEWIAKAHNWLETP